MNTNLFDQMIINLGNIDTSATPINDATTRHANARTLTDTSLMTFGKHKGQPLRDIPDGYLRWLWENGKKDEESPIASYIQQRLNIKTKAFKSPHPPNYFAVYDNEPLDPRWEEIFAQQHNDIPF